VDVALGIESLEPIHPSDAGIVDEQVDASEQLQHAVYRRVDLGRTRDVDRKCQRRPGASQFCDLTFQCLKPVETAGCQHDPAAAACQCQRDLRSDPG